MPTFIMSDCLMCPEPNTMAFGGVATGSMNAQEAATAIRADKITGENAKCFSDCRKDRNQERCTCCITRKLSQEYYETGDNQDSEE